MKTIRRVPCHFRHLPKKKTTTKKKTHLLRELEHIKHKFLEFDPIGLSWINPKQDTVLFTFTIEYRRSNILLPLGVQIWDLLLGHVVWKAVVMNTKTNGGTTSNTSC